MKYRILTIVIIALAIQACHHTHDHDTSHDHPEEVKFQFTAYSDHFELFAEADPFIAGQKANVLSHFSILPDFKAVELGSITIMLTVNGMEVKQKLEKPTRKGIYSFDIKPETAGTGTLRFEIPNEKGNFVVDVPEITVFNNLKEAEDAAAKIVVPQTNTTVFTKEQSWKVDFATGFPISEPFGQVIKTAALVQNSPGSEYVVSAKLNGIVNFNASTVFEGKNVSKGQSLFYVSGKDFAENNIGVNYSEAKNNYEKAEADYQRAKELAKDKIIAEKELLSVKNEFENKKAIFEHLDRNFKAAGQNISSPITGFIKQLFVKNGSFVQAGQPIAVVAQNKVLYLNAEVSPKYASILPNLKTANIRNLTDNSTFALEQLNGKVLSYGKSANSDNFLIPVTLQIENNGNFTPGNFVEVYFKTFSSGTTLTIPNEALIEDQGSFFVWVQVHPELFEKREVSIGGTDGVKTEIKKGLTIKDRIVTREAIMIKLAQATGGLDAHSGHVH